MVPAFINITRASKGFVVFEQFLKVFDLLSNVTVALNYKIIAFIPFVCLYIYFFWPEFYFANVTFIVLKKRRLPEIWG